MMRRSVIAALALGVLLSGCDLSDSSPVAVPAGPTAEATGIPQQTSSEAAQIEENYNRAVGEIESLLATDGREPIDVVRGELESGETFDMEILSLRSTETSLVLHLQILPTGPEPLDLRAVEGGLSGGLSDGDRSIADIALVDESSDLRVLPTVYRPDVAVEDSGQRCMCANLPDIVPPEGIRLNAHYVLPESGLTSLTVEVPGSEPSVPIGVG